MASVPIHVGPHGDPPRTQRLDDGVVLLQVKVEGPMGMGAVLFLGFLMAERIGAYVEGPFDRDGSCFSLPLNTLCSTITADLMQRELDFGRFQPSSDPTRWD